MYYSQYKLSINLVNMINNYKLYVATYLYTYMYSYKLFLPDFCYTLAS